MSWWAVDTNLKFEKEIELKADFKLDSGTLTVNFNKPLEIKLVSELPGSPFLFAIVIWLALLLLLLITILLCWKLFIAEKKQHCCCVSDAKNKK